jgi:cytochrome c
MWTIDRSLARIGPTWEKTMTVGRLGVWLAAGLVALGSGAALAAGDPAQGEKVFNKCKVCHDVKEEKNKIGPYLIGVVGRKAGSVEGFSYSEAMKDSGIVWDDATLDKYLADPKAVVPHTKMAFVGLSSEADRQNVIAYLESLSK